MALDPWHNDISMEFLGLYRDERLLWDQKHPYHKNRVEVRDAWERIQTGLSVQCSIADLKRKKESLLATYRQNCRKKQSKPNPEEWQPIWFAFTFMNSFLNDNFESDGEKHIKSEYYSTEDEEYTHSSSLHTERIPSSSANKRQSVPIRVNKPEPINRETTVSRSRADTNNEIDVCELYGNLLVRKLRRLDDDQRDMAMHEIDNIMFKATMKTKISQHSLDAHYDKRRKLKSPIFISSGQSHEDYEDVTYLEESIQDEFS